jgi:pimeloyl-ACP methyl ester carboxylesterase
MRNPIFPLLLLLSFSFSGGVAVHPPGPRPDYAQGRYWIALPATLHDPADTVPAGCSSPDAQSTAQADVFYVHPTVFLTGKTWNADLDDETINRKSENCVTGQATPFNACARVYAPRYRQAILRTFTRNDPEGPAALDTAYSDVKRAFEYYLAHWNHGRPIILAGHSQGARHIQRLLTDFFDGKPLQRQLVAAYAMGGMVHPGDYKFIPAGDSARQTGCVLAWNTVAWGTEEKDAYTRYAGCICVNPLSWERSGAVANAALDLGSVPFSFDAVEPAVCSACVHGGLLWVKAADEKAFSHYRHLAASYHVSDVHLFYMNIRENAADRVNAFLAKKQ